MSKQITFTDFEEELRDKIWQIQAKPANAYKDNRERISCQTEAIMQIFDQYYVAEMEKIKQHIFNNTIEATYKKLEQAKGIVIDWSNRHKVLGTGSMISAIDAMAYYLKEEGSIRDEFITQLCSSQQTVYRKEATDDEK